MPKELETREETEARIDKEIEDYAALANYDPNAPKKPLLPPE